MNETRWHEAVLMGGGGEHPCLDIIYPDGEVSRLLGFSKGQSIYTIDRSPDANSLALGTRAGQILVISDPWRGNGAKVDSLIQGAPVLSCCWCGDGRLAASDLAGRVLLWKLDEPANPVFLDSRKQVICALCKLDNDMVAGLSLGGSICIWRLNKSKPVFCLASQPPPPKFALVTLEYQARSNELVHPGRDGALISLQLDGGNSRTLDAHRGIFYAFSLAENAWITAGLEDRKLKVWPELLEDVASEYSLRQGLIKLTRFPDHPGLMVAIIEDGGADIIEINGSELLYHSLAPKGSYRHAVPALDHDQLQSIKKQRVDKTAADLEAALSQDDASFVDTCHLKLAQLGFEHIAFAIRSAWHIQQNEHLSALGYSAKLMGILPLDDARSSHSIQRHNQLLVRYGLFDEAMKFNEQMKAMNNSSSNLLCELTSLLDQHSDLEIIFDPVADLNEIIEAHTTLDRIFQGTFILSRQDSYRCPKLTSSGEDMANSLSLEFVAAGDGTPHARARAVNAILLSQSSFKVEEIIRIESTSENSIPINFGIILKTTMSHTNVVPMVLLSWTGGHDYRQSNSEALNYLEQLQGQTQHLDYLDSTYRIAMDFIRRMATEAQTNMAVAI